MGFKEFNKEGGHLLNSDDLHGYYKEKFDSNYCQSLDGLVDQVIRYLVQWNLSITVT